MPTVVELIRQGRNEELWQMCCGFLTLRIDQFMTIQRRLLLEQVDLLDRSEFGRKILNGVKPRTVEEFRQRVPLTTYSDYCPELSEKKEETLPVRPASWVHTSGRSGDYPCKWIPISPGYAHELGVIMSGIGMLAGCREWGDTSAITYHPRMVCTVAPRPYMTGALADILQSQTPINYLPALEEAERLPFDERIRLGFRQALAEGLDYFFGLSLVLVAVGNKFSQSSESVDIRPFLRQPKALVRLIKGMLKSKLSHRPMLPKDLWSVKGIISSGLDSWVYRNKIKELWGKYPLDVYGTTEGGVIATQTWDYGAMTFIPSLNFLEFIPEKEHFKWQLDRSYQPKTVLLDEVKAGENYEIVITNFHGGALARYRVGDMVKITSLSNERLGIDIPQMTFERRADGLLDFVVVRLTERSIWRAIEDTGVTYEDWTAHKDPGESVLRLFIELQNRDRADEKELATVIRQKLLHSDDDDYTRSTVHNDLADMVDFKVDVTLLPRGAFASYMAQRQAEGADLAHLKPPHINPSEKVLSLLLAKRMTQPEVMVRAEATTVQ